MQDITSEKATQSQLLNTLRKDLNVSVKTTPYINLQSKVFDIKLNRHKEDELYYWLVSAAAMGFFGYLRFITALTRGPKFIYSAFLVAIPMIGVLDHRTMIMKNVQRNPDSLKARLLFHPEVRETYERSISITDDYIAQLKMEIATLESDALKYKILDD